MGTMTYAGAESHILSVYFQNMDGGFGPFYVGLGNGAAPMEENTTLASMALREVTGTGYQRQIIFRDNDPSLGWSLNGDYVQSPELVFTNTGLTNWAPTDFAFLTLSSAGTNAPDLLISAVDFKGTTILKPGHSIRFRFRFRQTTFNFNYQRLICSTASVEASAFVFPAMFGNSLSGVATAGAETDLFYAVDPPDLTAFATTVAAGGVELQPYPDASVSATAVTTADAVCFP